MRKETLIFILVLILTLGFSGCGIIQRIQDEIDIANVFADFAPGFTGVLEGDDSLPKKAQDTLASQVSLKVEVGNDLNTSSSDVFISDNPFSVQFEIKNVSKDDFIVFLTATDRDEVLPELQDEWDKYDLLRSQDISNISIFADGTKLDEDTTFDRDTISDIRGIIDVGNNVATLQAQLEMDINEIPHSGYLKAGLRKSGDDWKIDSLKIVLNP